MITYKNSNMDKYKIIKFNEQYFDQTAELIALFRDQLRKYKGIDSTPDIVSASKELTSISKDENYPIYLCLENEVVVGYMMLKVDGVIWVEQIYVKESYRRKGIASLLYEEAEKKSKEIGEDTLFNCVHSNNEAIISFLKSKGYTVLNLIEIRKPYKEEIIKTTIKVGNNNFDY